MPYEFNHSSDLNNFNCPIECKQCSFEIEKPMKRTNTIRKTRCKMQVCLGLPYCWRHMRSKLHLRVGDSEIPNSGKGVFAYHPDRNVRRVFKKGESITTYDGELISKEEVDRRYSDSQQITAPYVFQIGTSGNNYIDAACIRGIGGMLNFKPYTGRRNPNNVKGRKVNGQNKVMLYAIKDIHNGDELYLDYGENYVVDLNDELHERHSTNYVRPRRRSRRR